MWLTGAFLSFSIPPLLVLATAAAAAAAMQHQQGLHCASRVARPDALTRGVKLSKEGEDPIVFDCQTCAAAATLHILPKEEDAEDVHAAIAALISDDPKWKRALELAKDRVRKAITSRGRVFCGGKPTDKDGARGSSWLRCVPVDPSLSASVTRHLGWRVCFKRSSPSGSSGMPIPLGPESGLGCGELEEEQAYTVAIDMQQVRGSGNYTDVAGAADDGEEEEEEAEEWMGASGDQMWDEFLEGERGDAPDNATLLTEHKGNKCEGLWRGLGNGYQISSRDRVRCIQDNPAALIAVGDARLMASGEGARLRVKCALPRFGRQRDGVPARRCVNESREHSIRVSVLVRMMRRAVARAAAEAKQHAQARRARAAPGTRRSMRSSSSSSSESKMSTRSSSRRSSRPKGYVKRASAPYSKAKRGRGSKRGRK